jgi:Lrp/AsnC family transcriptional regulator for asnA, asnC and gidA
LKPDRLDMKIVQLLQKNARIPFAEIAEEVGVSAGIVQSRYNKMRKVGIIKGTTIILDTNKIGISYYATLGVEALAPKVEEVISYIEGLRIENTSAHVWTAFGHYNLSVILFSKDLLEVHKIKQLIQNHPAVTSVNINLIDTPDHIQNAFVLKEIFME